MLSNAFAKAIKRHNSETPRVTTIALKEQVYSTNTWNIYGLYTLASDIFKSHNQLTVIVIIIFRFSYVIHCVKENLLKENTWIKKTKLQKNDCHIKLEVSFAKDT